MKSKNNSLGIVTLVTVSVAIFLGALFLINLLWNYVAPIFGLPQLTLIQFTSTYILVSLLRAISNPQAPKNNAYNTMETYEQIIRGEKDK